MSKIMNILLKRLKLCIIVIVMSIYSHNDYSKVYVIMVKSRKIINKN